MRTNKRTNLLRTMAVAFGAVSAIGATAAAADVHVYSGGSIASAINRASPGDRVLVHAGTYAGGWIQRNGSASAPIQVISVDGPRRAILSGGSEPLRIGGASSYLTFDGFEVRNSTDNVAHIDGESHHITLRNMFIHDAGTNGDVVKVNQASDITIENSELMHAGPRTTDAADNPCQELLDFVHVDNVTVRNNYFHDTCGMLFYVKGGGQNALVEGNTFSASSAGAADPMVGIGAPSDAAALAGRQYEAYNVTFRNNILMGGLTGALGVYDASGAVIANNLFLNNDQVLVQFRAGLAPAAASTNIRMVNNILADTRGRMPTPYVRSSHGLTNFTTANNLFWNNGSAIPSSSVLDIPSQPGHLVANPLITAPATTADRTTIISTSRPRSGSPAANSGLSEALPPTDITGAARNGVRDRGPYLIGATSGGTTPPPTDGGTAPPPTDGGTTPPPTTTKSVTYSTATTSGVLNTPVTITARSTGFTSPRYRFWAVTPAGAWTKPCGDYITAATCAFTPNATGTWTLAVVARDSTSTASYDAASSENPFAVTTATAPTPPPSSTKTVNFTVNPTAGVVNRTATITASSTGFTSPRYRFWVVTPSNVWTKPCGDYNTATSCTFTPNTTGNWTVAVVVRESTSTNNYDIASPERPYAVGTTSVSTTTTTATAASTSTSTAAACPPEPTTPDANGEPRNAAGDIRYCWPGEANCTCDADNDCYAGPGYVACNSVYSDTATAADGSDGSTGGTGATGATDTSGDTGGGVGCNVRGTGRSNGMLTTAGLFILAFAVSQFTRRRNRHVE